MSAPPTPIPLPSDDYDRPHSTTALLASLRCTTSSFDAVMDSLSSSTSQHVRRVQSLEARVRRARSLIQKLEQMHNKDNSTNTSIDDIVRIECPADYYEALRGIDSKLVDEIQPRLSAIEAARNAADKAILATLRKDAMTDDGEAIPSDAWLDRPSMGIGGLAHSLQVAEAQRRVPPLYGSLIGEYAGEEGRCMDEMEYHGILESIAVKQQQQQQQTIQSETRGGGMPTNLAPSPTDDESVHSTTSRMSALSMSSNTSSSRMTAIQRRRWHEQQKQLRIMQAGGTAFSEKEEDGSTAAASSSPRSPKHTPKTTTVVTNTSISGRQQAINGSHPYLCEVLHDSYGIGSDPPGGLIDCSGFTSRRTREGGCEFYPPPSSAADLMVFNTTRESYGLANRRAAAVMASSGVPVGGRTVGEGGSKI